MDRRLLQLAAPLAVGALLLSACGGSKTPAPSTSSSSSAAAGGPTYTIAYQGPLSGGDAQLGLNMKYAVQLAINQANAGTTFGTLPFTLKFTSEDDQGSPTQAPSAVQKILQDSSVIAVVGPAFSGATRASEPLYSQVGMATVSPSATAPDLATHGWKNFFRVVADDNSQGPADATYIGKTLKLSTVYSVDDGSAYASGLIKAFDGAASANGISIVSHETDLGTTQCQEGTGNVQQYGATATKVKSLNPKAVFYAGYYCGFALLTRALRTAGYTGQLVSDDGSNDPKYVSEATPADANGTYISCACQESITGSSFSAFSAAFKQLAGFVPGTYSAESYDATNAIIAVLKGAAAALGSTRITRSDLVAGLHNSAFQWQGVSKLVKFQGDGNFAGSAVYMYKVTNGTIVEVGLIS